MEDLLAARGQMALSLGFHILFAVAGMAMPLLMVMAEWMHLKTGEALYLDLARRWAKGTAILFAVGAVSGTVLSFELGLLWPGFMAQAGPLIGLPFSLEGFAFFTEAIFLGVYLYGWERVSKRVHLIAGVVVSVSGLISGVFVVAVNSWMNAPTGFVRTAEGFTQIHPWGPFQTEAFATQALHMALAAYASVAILVLGIHAIRLLSDPDNALHQVAARLAFLLAVIAVPAQILSGDLSAKHIAKHQPAKLAAAEAHFHTQRRAPLTIGGWPDEETGERIGALEIPGGLSFLAHGDFDAEVTGLDAIPRDLWPPVVPVHLGFQVMVGSGSAMLGLVLFGLFLWLRGHRFPHRDRRFLWAAALATPLGLIALEAGWTVTEVGRQPWIIHGVLLTRDAVTPMPALVVPLVVFSMLYLFLSVVVLVLLRAHVFSVPLARRIAR